MPTTRSSGGSSRKGPSAHSEVIAMLKDDHNRAKKAFTEFEKLDVLEDSAECEALVKQTCAELEAHAMLEEELFYPAAREALDEDDLIDEAEVEHMTVRMLIEQLKDMSPEEEKYAATFKVLGEYVKHHLKEEEEEMFGQLSRAKIDWDALEQKMLERREELMSQLLPAAGKKAEKPAEAAKAKPQAKGKEKSKRGRQTSDVSDIDQAEEVEEIGAGRSDDTLYAGADDDE
jgi:hypothetical protein